MHPDFSYSRLASKLLLALGIAMITVVEIIALFQSNPAMIVMVVGGIALIVGISLSGNPRLFCFWGLFITAPINLDVAFVVISHMGGAGAYTIDLVDIFIFSLLFFQIRDLVRGFRTDLRFSKVALFWGGLIFLGVIDIITGPLRHVPAHEAFRMIKLLLLFVVIINEVVRVKQFKNILLALMIGVILQCLIGLSQYMFDASLGATILGEAPQEQVEFTSKATYQSGEFTRRVGALFGHPNLLAIYLAMMLPIAIALQFARIYPPYKVILSAITVMGVTVLILTLSRSGWVSFAFGFMTLMTLSFVNPQARNRFLFTKIALLVLVFVIAFLLSGPILKRLFESGGGAVDFRWEWMAVSWEMIKAKPIFGFGLNTFVFNAPAYTDYGTAGRVMEEYASTLPVVHNIYLLVWTEQGTVGLLLYLALNGYLLMLGWRNTKYFNNDMLYMINIGCMAAMAAHAVDGMSSFFLRNPAPGRVYFIVAGLIVAIYYWNRENAHLYQPAPRSLRSAENKNSRRRAESAPVATVRAQ